MGGTLQKSLCAVALILVFPALNSGCLVLAATVIYIATQDQDTGPTLNNEGWLEQTLPYPIDVVRPAALQALEANGMQADSRSTEDAGYVVNARYGDGLDVVIELDEPTPYSTAVRIRIGPDGHVERSGHLLDTIAEFAVPAP